ncbi:amylo-alpha-1,6-glucosidase [Synechococcus sp. PCC 7335]|uniref:amylo-alpha-1,6-glucosidase n=1 Tax=Synechococcus sp. (strain ATCC 29403 / PCC 7335) TaxID=91464 RepID=UPI0012FBE3D3|nr:amylo-alpha-1,6-glucosidase [Synechococcus sp. PCC 7335]
MNCNLFSVASTQPIDFGRDICGDLLQSTNREWLITNGIGGYGCGTLSGMLTRCYHGLLVAALEPPLGRTLLFTKLDEVVQYLDISYPLSCDRWAGGTITGNGYRHLERFRLEGTIPTWTYACADALLEKRIWMQLGENTTYIQYKLLRATAPFQISIKVIVNHRNHHHVTHSQQQNFQQGLEDNPTQNPLQNQSSSQPQNHYWKILTRSHPRGLKVEATGCPVPIYLLTTKGQLQPINRWYQHYFLTQEKYRGLSHIEDHFHCATIRTTLTPGEVLTIAASTEPYPNLDEKRILLDRQQYEQNLLDQFSISLSGFLKSDQPVQEIYSDRSAVATTSNAVPETIVASKVSTLVSTSLLQQLVLAADQFIVRRTITDLQTQETTDGKSIIAGYPWFGDWGRDTMIALPGLTVATGRTEVARPILRTFAYYLSQGMLPNAFPEANSEPGYNTVDAIFWYFEAIRAYVHATEDNELLEELFPALESVITWHLRGTRYNIHLDQADGLIYAGEEGLQLTWMDAKVDDWVVTPRIGKPVEINALWHNAVLCMADFCDRLGRPNSDYLNLARCCADSFSKFWNASVGYCYDVIDGPDGNDPSLRPNQLFAVSLAYAPPLDKQKQKSIVNACAQQLVTSYGLRSLAQSHTNYVGKYGGDRTRRDGAYHQGTTWSWLIGPFVQAHLKVYKDPELSRSFLIPLMQHICSGCVGTLGEIFDGDAPFLPRGAYAQAWSVAEVLRVCQLIEQQL